MVINRGCIPIDPKINVNPPIGCSKVPFISKLGHVATIPLQYRRTVNEDWYTTVCLPEIINMLRKINPERRIILHQDNASLHTAQRTMAFLEIYPPYSPDLSLDDFFTFPKNNNQLRTPRWKSSECLSNGVFGNPNWRVKLLFWQLGWKDAKVYKSALRIL